MTQITIRTSPIFKKTNFDTWEDLWDYFSETTADLEPSLSEEIITKAENARKELQSTHSSFKPVYE